MSAENLVVRQALLDQKWAEAVEWLNLELKNMPDIESTLIGRVLVCDLSWLASASDADKTVVLKMAALVISEAKSRALAALDSV